ncbi:hypothetical protein [Streptomyces scabichelini]|uniref:hypothetical protein n=1 Tax=Streptomyces scabichelini TaxID=2711217 RepID=UPI001F494CD9|nr:hypothetical protein [Streptomyces scabichelini]
MGAEADVGDAAVMDAMEVIEAMEVMDVSWWTSTASATDRVRNTPYAQRTAMPPPL